MSGTATVVVGRDGSQGFASRFSEALFFLIAFSVLGVLFATPHPTLLVSILVIVALMSAMIVKPIKEKFRQAIVSSEFRCVVWPFITWFVCHLLVAVLAGAPVHLSFTENAFRFVLALAVLGLVAELSAWRWFLWSLPFAAVCGAAHGIHGIVGFGTQLGRTSGWTNNPIYFGNLTALVMLLSLSAGLLERRLPVKLRLLLCLAAVLAAFSSLSSGTRSSGMLLMCVLPLLLWRKKDRFHRIGAAVVTALAAVLIVIVFSSASVRQIVRINELKRDVVEAGEKNFNTSAGARIQMWKASLLIFQDHPVAGIGPGKFEAELKRLIAEKKLLPIETFNQPHSDLLRAASFGGLLLLLAYIGILAGPLLYFFAQLKRSRPEESSYVASLLGIQVVVAYFLFGLTNATFDQQIYSTTYAVLICVLTQIAHYSQPTLGSTALPEVASGAAG